MSDIGKTVKHFFCSFLFLFIALIILCLSLYAVYGKVWWNKSRCDIFGKSCSLVAWHYKNIEHDNHKYIHYTDKDCNHGNEQSCFLLGVSTLRGEMDGVPVEKDFRTAENYFQKSYDLSVNDFQKAHNLRGLALSYYLLGDVQTATDYAQKYCEASGLIKREVAGKNALGLPLYKVLAYSHNCTLNSQLYYTIALAYDYDLNDKHEAGKFMRYACLEKSPEACDRLTFYARKHTSDGDYGVYESEGRQFAKKACNYAKALYDHNHCSNVTGPKYRELYCGYDRSDVIVGMCEWETLYILEEL